MTKTQQQCKTCNGCGLVKTPIKVCPICLGKKCVRCPVFQSGYANKLYSECEDCWSTGSVQKK